MIQSTPDRAGTEPRGDQEARSGRCDEIDPVTALDWLERGEAVMIDVRDPDEHARERIAGAVLAPLKEVRSGAFQPNWAGRTPILFCRTGRRSAEAARHVRRAGHDEAYTLAGGIEAWRRAGLPTERTRGVPISIMRQVQITAGALTLLGTVLGAFVSPWLLLIPAFIGAGLTFAGATGTCGLAAVLVRMPWNKPLRAGGDAPSSPAKGCCSS